MVVALSGLSPVAAFEVLREVSQRTNVKLIDVAVSVVQWPQGGCLPDGIRRTLDVLYAGGVTPPPRGGSAQAGGHAGRLGKAPAIVVGAAGNLQGAVSFTLMWTLVLSQDLTCGNVSRSRPRLVHRPRHGAASGCIRLHIREDPGLSVSAGDGVFGHLMRGAPGRIRTCAHGSGVNAQIAPHSPLTCGGVCWRASATRSVSEVCRKLRPDRVSVVWDPCFDA